jgi:predicted nucleotidyltransferase
MYLNGTVFVSELASRKAYSKERIQQLRKAFAEASKFASDKACVYVTGSLGRLEASSYSDLDVFIAGKSEKVIQPDGSSTFGEKNILSHLDEICIQAELIKVSRQFKYKNFSSDGRYLDRHSIYEFTNALGTEKDDVTNTFTARLLLLLESQPLIEDGVYEDIVKEVIKSYWRDYDGHEGDFMPVFLANDILRLWRTFCVNYEARTEGNTSAEKKLKNYKLKHSRILTCYSALLFLLETYAQKGTVSPEDAFAMVKTTPTARLEWLGNSNNKTVDVVEKLIEQYDGFLASTNFEEAVLLRNFSQKEVAEKLSNEAAALGSLMFDALQVVGSVDSGKAFYRMLMV